MNILHVHTKGRKLDTLEQLEIYKHTKTNKNDILNEQTQDVYKRQVIASLTNYVCVWWYLLKWLIIC